MSDISINETDSHREKLAPVVATIVGLYVVILTSSYFIGNMIYQIP